MSFVATDEDRARLRRALELAELGRARVSPNPVVGAVVATGQTMIDEGYHPMTVYFPLVVHGAMLIEPTESE